MLGRWHEPWTWRSAKYKEELAGHLPPDAWDEYVARAAEKYKERLTRTSGVDPLVLTPLPEVRITDPNTGGQKGQKRQRMELLPEDTLMWASEQYDYGAQKYSDRNWEKGYAWSLTYGALRRHMAAWWQGEEMDPDSDNTQHHLQAVVFHALALATYSHRGLGTDDRPGKG